jgi:spermidine/putrescine transport system substrate-binding protein
MDIKEFRSRIDNHDISRRQAMQALSAVGVGVVAQPVLSSAARADSDPAEMINLTWSGYDVPELFPQYVEKYGTLPSFSYFSSQDEAMQKVRAGFPADVWHPCSSNTRRFTDAGTVTAIDTSRLEHWNDFWPELQTMEGVVVYDEVHLVPCDWGNTSICYRTDVFGEDYDESWAMILDPAYAGRISVPDSTDNLVGVALAIGIDPYTMTDEQLQLVKEAMQAQRDNVRFYWESATEILQAMAAGEIDLAVCWNETVVHLSREGIPVKFANPKEGLVTWVCGLVHNPGGEADEQLVYDFINAWTSPEAGHFLINDYGYGHSNMKSFETVPPERLAELGLVSPGEMLSRTMFAIEGPAGMRDKWNIVLDEVRLGM